MTGKTEMGGKGSSKMMDFSLLKFSVKIKTIQKQ